MRRHLRDWPVKLPRVNRVGKYRYHRLTGAALPLGIPEEHPDFTAAWAVEEAKSGNTGNTPGKAGSLAQACDDCQRSAKFIAYSADYRRALILHIEAIRAEYGEAAAKGLRQHHVQRDLDKLTSHRQRHRRKAWAVLCGFLKSEGRCPVDASKGVEIGAMPKGDGYVRWELDEVDAYRERWAIGTIQRKAFELVYWTAARTVDAVALSPSNVARDGLLTFRQSKTGGLAYVPWTCALPAWCDEWWEAGRTHLHTALAGHQGFTWLETNGGRARSKKGLSNLISDGARDAGIEGRSAHGLRTSRLTLIAEWGGPEHAIMSWGGHTSPKEAAGYTRDANRRKILIGRAKEA